MLDKPHTCVGCPAYSVGIGYVPPRGPLTSPLFVVVGQGPGEREVARGLPFVGPSGAMLSSWLRTASVEEHCVLFDNVTRCRLVLWTRAGEPILSSTGRLQDRPPTTAEAAFCWARHGLPTLREALQNVPAERRCIVACGVPAMTTLLSLRGRATFAGNVFDTPLAKVICVNHPSWVFRGNWAHGAIQPRFLARAKEIAEGRYAPPPDPDSVPPSALLFPLQEDLAVFLESTAGPYAVDVECAGGYLICVGILDVPSERYVCVRFRQQGGDLYEPGSLRERTAWLYAFLADRVRQKVFHNGQAFDIPYLETVGFQVEGFVDDTMLQAHLTYAELPKRLEFLALIYANMVRWKVLVADSDDPKED